MERNEVKAIVENILLASDDPVTEAHLAQTIQIGMTQSDFRSILYEIKEDYQDRNLQVMEVAEGYLLCTRTEFSDWIKKYFRMDKESKLSQPALDALSIIAYKQPITRTEVEEIRGVDSAGVIKTLLEKNVIHPAGRKKVPGRPMMYKTTRKFLEYFGLKDLSDLPTLEDLKEADITGDNLDSQHMQTKLIFSDPEVGGDAQTSIETVSEDTKDSQIASSNVSSETNPRESEPSDQQA